MIVVDAVDLALRAVDVVVVAAVDFALGAVAAVVVWGTFAAADVAESWKKPHYIFMKSDASK